MSQPKPSSREDFADPWARWLLHDRHGGDPLQGSAVEEAVRKYADRVLDALPLKPGMTLADIGSGDGLIAFRAIERTGHGLRVILAERSAELLRHARHLATERNIEAQCQFVQCEAEDLSPIEDCSVDAVTTRAVLAYVPDKVKALREFHRILRPGGCLSLAEPIMQDDAFMVRAMRLFLEGAPKQSTSAMRLMHRWKAAQFPDTDEAIRQCPITNFGERDLIRQAHEVGFVSLHLELHIDFIPSPEPPSWEAFVRSSPHPLAPPLEVILQEHFTPAERVELERILRPRLQDPNVFGITRIAYLTGRKAEQR
jgi:ubiquinone/menaquinone biosynthesis C-methylase UbiE